MVASRVALMRLLLGAVGEGDPQRAGHLEGDTGPHSAGLRLPRSLLPQSRGPTLTRHRDRALAAQVGSSPGSSGGARRASRMPTQR